MLRFLLRVTCCLLLAFTGIGAALSRESGWSKYTSDELYVVYWQHTRDQTNYFIVNTDGNSEGEKLTWQEETIKGLDCSPDGQTLAFQTDAKRLYVIDSGGLANEKDLDQYYSELSVANNQQVALFQQVADGILVDSVDVRPLVPPSLDERYRVHVSSQGFELWSADFSSDHGIQILSPTHDMILSLPDAYLGEWLASEEVFSFAYLEINNSSELAPRQYIMDLEYQIPVPMPEWINSRKVSPDRTMVGLSAIFNGIRPEQIYVTSISSNGYGNNLQLTHNSETASWFHCFLTFRPEILLTDSP